MKRATCSEPRGFTLIEMLVAITLLAVMAVIAWQGLDAMTRGRERLIEHDSRLDSLKLLYGQFQTDCEQLADPDALQAAPAEVGNGQLMLVRDRREEGRPGAWQVVAYRIEGGTVVRAATAPLYDRASVQSALVTLRQGGNSGGNGANGAMVRPLLTGADGLSSRAWVEPGGWLIDNGAVRAALQLGSATAATAASAPIGMSPATVRGLELAIAARMGDGDAPRRFEKLCMTGR